MKIFKKNIEYPKNWNKSKKFLELAVKTICALVIPGAFATIMCLLWLLIFHQNNIHFNAEMSTIVNSSWILAFSVLYSILIGIVINTVWTEYKAMRTAVKRWDIDTFMDLRDEEMSPLVHALVLMFSIAILLTFMGQNYGTAADGVIIVGSTAYFLALIFFVIVEIDNPCSGFWFIKSIPEEWLKIDPKAWRDKRSQEAKKKFQKHWTEANA